MEFIMVTQDLHFALARPTLRDCVHLKKNEREGKKKKPQQTQAHLILGKDLEESNVYCGKVDCNEGSRPWG